MKHYIDQAKSEVNQWKVKVNKKPTVIDNLAKKSQQKINSILPDKYHTIMTESIKNISKAVISGSEFITKKTYSSMSFYDREELVRKKIETYKTTAMIEGAGTGAGGFLVGLADFPLLLTIKFKFLFDVASIYGFDVRNYKERLFILHVFQLAFSSKNHSNKIFSEIENWEEYSRSLPSDINEFDWKTFQQEYRDYIDLAKLLQMLPAVGAFVGAYVNSKLLDKLGETAMNCYRMRLLYK
ncbi:EcsC family protein [Clostridium folliculivorans]|uniref:ABC transporter-associated protein EcsC n=1 Tax=Clostridium folliculivorans TaxID=2886038 RepID=A0A9W6DB31_9CLOT|nr:EcsC family protein [Clostridium folliculivorans]GKU25995.1 ABC transporter-associated protein EcsC [Clostridium folliculivorans]GKU28081.1 ABC transporter-associated protein EcsC [Clostridium folliculivorans]